MWQVDCHDAWLHCHSNSGGGSEVVSAGRGYGDKGHAWREAPSVAAAAVTPKPTLGLHSMGICLVFVHDVLFGAICRCMADCGVRGGGGGR